MRLDCFEVLQGRKYQNCQTKRNLKEKLLNYKKEIKKVKKLFVKQNSENISKTVWIIPERFGEVGLVRLDLIEQYLISKDC